MSFATIFKDSAASVKAWQSRTRAVNFTDENFQNWFGDSKLVNEDGSPMPLYHGTPGADIQQMKMSKDGALGAGVYLTPDASFASTYADASNLPRDKELFNDVPAGPSVLKLYASIRKPLYIDHDETTKTHDPMVIALKNLGMPEEKASKLVEAAYEKNGYVGKQVMSRATAAGYDGLIQRRNGKITEVVAFSPQQVKSAISNEGTYYRGLPHIQKEETMFSQILKTSAGALKAWESRKRNAKASKLGIVRTKAKVAAKPAKATIKPQTGDNIPAGMDHKTPKPKKHPKDNIPKEQDHKEPAAPKAKKWPDPVPSPKNRLSPEAPPEHKAKMTEYMGVYSGRLKNPKEKAYVEARVAQMIAGTPRPSGMSAQYGLTKQRAVQYEILNQKIFSSGRLKHNI